MMTRKLPTWQKFLDEKENQQRDFSSTQINLPKAITNEIIAFSKEHIPDSFLYQKENNAYDDYGREINSHVTILYGLKDEDPDAAKKILEQQRPVVLKLGRISAFDTNDEYDVIKIDVNSPDLHKLHKLLKALPFHNDYPRYQPHVTIAYVKKGKGKRIIGNGTFDGEIIKTNKVVFSSLNGDKTEIELKK